MSVIVVMPGGFHPFHAGHYALYQAATRVFPKADVYVAATNDTSARPFPFPVKEKLAKLAGVAPGRFVQVKSPFRAEEITTKYNPNKDILIFVRSEKDATKPPQAGGTKKDGTPAYLQPLVGQKKLEPFSKHAYMAYLPTVEFGPGMTSATEIRTAWPQLNDKRKQALVMSLYPATQKNPALVQNVVKLLDTAILPSVSENQGWAATLEDKKNSTPAGVVPKEFDKDPELRQAMMFAKQHYPQHKNDPMTALLKMYHRAFLHNDQEDSSQDKQLKIFGQKLSNLEQRIAALKTTNDYIEEKKSL
jgi:hypothetical protein